MAAIFIIPPYITNTLINVNIVTVMKLQGIRLLIKSTAAIIPTRPKAYSLQPMNVSPGFAVNKYAIYPTSSDTTIHTTGTAITERPVVACFLTISFLSSKYPTISGL